MLVEQEFPPVSEYDTFDGQKNEKIKIPKKTSFNYKFTCWVPMNPKDYPTETYQYPILAESQYKMLTAFKLLVMSRECGDCKKTIYPKPSDSFKLPTVCPYCKNITKKTLRMTNPKITKEYDFKRSSTVQRLSALLDVIFQKYHLNSEFIEDTDYTKRYHNSLNRENYLTWTINKDAAEVKSCIDGLISWDKFPQKYFMIDDKTHGEIFHNILDSEGILKFEPFYKLLIMASSVIKAVVPSIKPQLRGARMSPANVTNISTLNQK